MVRYTWEWMLAVFYRDNAMSDWSLFNSDLPNVEIFELEIKYNANKILAATYGRGLWESPLNAFRIQA